MAYEMVFNPTDRPLVVDEEGRVIGGGEWSAIDTSEDMATALVRSGALLTVQIDPTAPNISAGAQYAIDRMRYVDQRHDAAQAMDKDDIIALLRDSGRSDLLDALPRGGDNKPSKEDLVEVLVENQDIIIPAAGPAPTDPVVVVTPDPEIVPADGEDSNGPEPVETEARPALIDDTPIAVAEGGDPIVTPVGGGVPPTAADVGAALRAQDVAATPQTSQDDDSSAEDSTTTRKTSRRRGTGSQKED